MRADVAGGTIVGTAYLVLAVTFLAVLPRHDAADLERLMLGNIAAMTTRASEGRIAVRAVLGRMADGTLADRVVARRGGDL